MQPPEPKVFRNVGNALALLRELRGLTQTECARRARMTKSQLSRYEIDKELPKLDSLARLLGVLAVEADGFFAVVQAVDYLTAGEVASEMILRTLLDRRQRVLEEFLDAARVRLCEQPTPPLAKGRKSSWSRISSKPEVTAELGDAAGGGTS